MLTKIDPDKKIDKKNYKSEMVTLKKRLFELQRQVFESGMPVLIVFEGWSSSGKGTLIGKILNPLDPRYFNVYTMGKLSEDETMRPVLYSYFTKLPGNGRITILDKSWHRTILSEGMRLRSLGKSEADSFYSDINAFERQVTDSGVLIIKLFLHISRDEQKQRFKELEKNPGTRWRVNEADWEQNREYTKCLKEFSAMLEMSNFDNSPWSIIESNDKSYSTLKVFKTVIEKIENGLSRRKQLTKQALPKLPDLGHDFEKILGSVNLDKKVSEAEYKDRINFYQKRISELGFKLYSKRRSVVMVYEGWDAAGKGGNIKRMTEELDPRGYEVVPIAAPTKEELEHHYLQRFWKKYPKDGHISIFDRSWYGRVMVERVEGFCTAEEWSRAYREINEMEKHMHNHGTLIFKFWLQIDQDEQLLRFKGRQDDTLKQYKITDEDWRNRDKWDEYENVVNEMIARTNTEYAPWLIVESNDKKYARIKTLEYVVKKLEKAIE